MNDIAALHGRGPPLHNDPASPDALRMCRRRLTLLGGIAMFCRVRSTGMLVLAVALAVAARAHAVAPEIRDEGKFFSPEAVKKANEQLRDIYRKYGKDVLIETLASIPADHLEKVKAMSDKDKTAYFRKQVLDRVKERVVNGIYILVTKEPKYLYVDITPKARNVFDREFYDRVRELLFANFGENRFDEGLAAALKAAHEKLEKSASK
jgi:hypothetical protein